LGVLPSFTPEVHLYKLKCPGKGVVFWRGNAAPLAYTMTATYNISNRKNAP